MGYTHYWTPTRNFTAAEWSAICEIAQTVFESARGRGITITGPMGTGDAEITADAIAFNGDPAHESMVFSRRPEQSRGFCKTAGKPYDWAVVLLLSAARRLAPGSLDLDSDGGTKVFDIL